MDPVPPASRTQAQDTAVGTGFLSAVPPWAWAVLALVFGLACTLWVNRYERNRIESEQHRNFDISAGRSYDELKAQLRSCEFLVRAVQSLFLASDDVQAREFEVMFDNMRADHSFPSLQAIAYAQRIPMADGDHYITTMAAPMPKNAMIIGLDVNTQPMNLRGALQSGDTDQVAMSAPFRLKQQQGTGTPTDGITMRLPVYTPGYAPATVAERRARMRGSVAASFRVASLIADAFPPAQYGKAAANVAITDVTEARPRDLYRLTVKAVNNPHYQFDRDLDYGGRVWRVVVSATETMQPVPYWTSMFWPGILSSLLLAALVWSVASTRMRAIELGRRMGERYRSSEERFRRLNDLLPTLVILADRTDDSIAYANESARSRLGLDAVEKSLTSLFVDGSEELLTATASGRVRATDVQLHDQQGEPFWASASMTPVEFDGRAMWLLVASDISEHRRLTERLSYQASHDALTKLLNRQEFESRVERLLAKPGFDQGALLFIDLDQFKLINDTSGHIAGDELLVQLAMMMRDQLRPEDMLGRLGGDEFGVLLATIPTVEVGYQAAERLRRSLDGYVFAWEQRSYTVSASIGGVLTGSGTSMKELFAHADTACYLAKEAGRNRVHFYSEDDDATTRRMGEMEWANRLRWAVKEDRLLLDYQELWPIQRMQGKQAPRIELLLRLREEDGRIVLPGAFLPAAERYGLMPVIDRWVIGTALANFDRLHPSGNALGQCAINLSGASLEEPDLFDFINELISQHRLDPKRLSFEITETVAVRNFGAATMLIDQLRGAGCSVALDDFGAGMSSFGYLKNLEVDTIKIDGSFVLDIATDPMSQSIVKAVTEIGHQRGLSVVAEWVASESLCRVLADIGVDYAQGFALHRPERVVFQRG